MSKPRALLSFAVFLAAFSWVAYRSVTAGVSASEATAYNHYITRPAASIFTLPFHPANNVLNSVVTRQTLEVLRTTEWSLRLVSLIGLLLYFSLAWRFGVAGLLFAANPLVLGWLPDSSGLWVACACFVLAVLCLTSGSVSTANLSTCSILLGIAVGFQSSFLLPSLALVFLQLHIQFWAGRGLSFSQAVNCLLLPGALLMFTCWIFPLLNSAGMKPVRSGLSQITWIVMLPGLAGVGLFIGKRNAGAAKLCGGLAVVLIGCAFAFVRAGFAQMPNLFENPPESALPKVARALRDDLRRHQAKSFMVGASTVLIEPVNFYRRRYALGAVKGVVPPTLAKSAEYLILLPQDQAAALGTTRIFANGELTLYRRSAAP